VIIFAAPLMAKQKNIHLNQAGYRPADKKFLISIKDATYFTIYRESDKKWMYSNQLKGPVDDKDSGYKCFIGDFSEFDKPGRYYIEVERAGRSYPFEIKADVYSDVFRKVMHGYYLWRCGQKVEGDNGYGHEACHLEKAEIHPSAGRDEGKMIDVSGGWHDAGDYGKYSVNNGVSTGTLILMYERYGQRLADVKTGIPEHQKDKKYPDILNEIKYSLDWMMKMQRNDGAVYHKATSLTFPEMNLKAEDDNSAFFVIGLSSTGTADFAAAMAAAYRVFKDYDSSYAKQCLDSAKKAWQWLKRNPGMVPEGGYKNPEDVKTGQYGDWNDADERLWAAAELFAATGDSEYRRYFEENYNKFDPVFDSAPSWQQVKEFAMMTYIASGRKGKSEEVVGKIKNDMLEHGKDLLARIGESGYRNVMRESDYVWGSNSVSLNYAINLLRMYDLTLENKYKEAARESLDYVMGRNPLGISYITGVGEYAVENIHHRPSAADGRKGSWPGYLAGGPNKNMQDKILKKLPFGTPPAKCFIDHVDSYASNEIAVNWNAPLAYVLAAFLPDDVKFD